MGELPAIAHLSSLSWLEERVRITDISPLAEDSRAVFDERGGRVGPLTIDILMNVYELISTLNNTLLKLYLRLSNTIAMISSRKHLFVFIGFKILRSTIL